MANRLAAEKSPYLLQHKDNPVDWYPWGSEAFELAAKRDCPIFLSIGYATCHWCHVMERESFEDAEIGRLMNDAFVAIKVDREERPDLDAVFMAVCQLSGSHCGWPLTVILTPEREPFFVATYLPRESTHGRIGMRDFIPRVQSAWAQDKDAIRVTAEDIRGHLQRFSTPEAGTFDPRWSDLAYQQLQSRFDPEYGGFSEAPKFPAPHNLLFLLRKGEQSPRNSGAVSMVSHTLKAMRRGGIFDQVGYGFHRYSTDSSWTLPHFEKMLYDQAMLCWAYAEAFAVTGEPEFRDTVLEIAEYVHRDLTDPSGAFLSAEDADSEGEEGLFYLWSTDELDEILGDDADEFKRRFSATTGGNYLDESTRQSTGLNILHHDRRTSVVRDQDVDRLLHQLAASRNLRERPFLDDKVLADWNGLMIHSLSSAGRLLGSDQLLRYAMDAYRAVTDLLRQDSHRLWHRYRDGSSGIEGTLQDYVGLVCASLSLYQSTHEVAFLEDAVAYQLVQDELFQDQDDGGYFQTASDSEKLLVRLKDFSDGALPSGNAMALRNLVKLYQLTGNERYSEVADGLVSAGASHVSRYPSAYTGFLLGAELLTTASTEIVIVCRTLQDADPGLKAIGEHFLPNSVVHVLTEYNQDKLVEVAPYLTGKIMLEDRCTYYVCSGFACKRPVTKVSEFQEILSGR